MVSRSGSRAIVLMAALVATMGSAAAFDDARYPDLKGQWTRAPAPAGIRGQPSFDPSKSSGRGQEAPLTPEYQAIFEANLADQARRLGRNRQGQGATRPRRAGWPVRCAVVNAARTGSGSSAVCGLSGDGGGHAGSAAGGGGGRRGGGGPRGGGVGGEGAGLSAGR